MRRIQILFLAFVVFGCAAPTGPTIPGSPATKSLAEANASEHWTRAFDLDGDGENDEIRVTYTGGAHCCYRLGVWLTAAGRVRLLPFELDGGYVGGLDLSQPRRFDVRESEGDLPELVMEIETYNGEPRPLPRRWRRKYGISSHYIGVRFSGGRVQVRDVPRFSRD